MQTDNGSETSSSPASSPPDSSPPDSSPDSSPASSPNQDDTLSPSSSPGDAASASAAAAADSEAAAASPADSSSPLATLPPSDAQTLRSSLSRLMSNSLVQLLEGLETLVVYTRNLIHYPSEKKYRKIKLSNIHYQERLGHLEGAEEAMALIGYVPQGEYLKLDERRMKDPNNEARLQAVDQLVQERLEELKKQWAVLPARTPPTHPYKCVTAVGSHSAIGKRHNMEDDEIMVDAFCGVDSQGYFGLYDGHGGRATVDFVVKALHINLEQYLKANPEAELQAAFKHSYLMTDGQLRRQSILRSGTTSVTCVIREVEGKRMLFTANVGDSRAVLCRGGKAVRLTIDHKASLPEEAKRIRDAGGFIGRNKRVNGVLAISRALGDHMLKHLGGGLNDVVSAEPYCSDTELTEEDSYVLLACDGVWDVMSDQEAIDFLVEKMKQCEQQVRQAKMKGISAEADDNTQGETEEKTKSAEDSPSPSDPSSSTAASSSSPASSSSSPSSVSLSPSDLNEVLHLASKALVREALERRSQDNVTVMIVALKK